MASHATSGTGKYRRLLFRIFLLCLFSALLIGSAGFFVLRSYESSVTFHPTPYGAGDDDWKLAPGAEDVWFKGAGGARLHGWFVSARQQPATATILYLHGNAGNVTNVGWIGSALAWRGFDILLFDYRGYGRSEGEVSDENGIYSDADAAYDYLTSARGVDPERLALFGQSLGTTAAVDSASRRACAAIVLESGPSSASDMAQVMLPWVPRWLHRVAKNRFESARKLAGIHCPVLVTHGSNDDVIPVAQGRALYDAANEPKRLIVVQGADHNVAGFAGDEYLDSIADFIRSGVVRGR